MATINPVTTSGWYENADCTITEYTWRGGRLDAGRTVASWAAVPTREQDLASAASADAASRIAEVP